MFSLSVFKVNLITGVEIHSNLIIVKSVVNFYGLIMWTVFGFSALLRTVFIIVGRWKNSHTKIGLGTSLSWLGCLIECGLLLRGLFGRELNLNLWLLRRVWAQVIGVRRALAWIGPLHLACRCLWDTSLN